MTDKNKPGLSELELRLCAEALRDMARHGGSGQGSRALKLAKKLTEEADEMLAKSTGIHQ